MELKATGIVRRIDDLGRVVIPREIRRTLDIHEGDALELYSDESGVYFKKYDADIKQFIAFFETIKLTLYRMGLIVGLYASDRKQAGHPSLPMLNNELMRRHFGVWNNIEWSICHTEDMVTDIKEEAILTMAVATMKEFARKLWGED